MTLIFESPELLAVAALAVPVAALGWFALPTVERVRRILMIAARTLVILALAVAMAGPSLERRHHDVTVIGVLDVSGSIRAFGRIPGENEQRRIAWATYMRDWFRQATTTRAPGDRFGLIVFDGASVAIAAPTRNAYTDDRIDLTIRPGTNIEDALRLGLALFPADAARRLVLVTDGNETAGHVRRAVREAAAAGNIPIDVIPISYRAVRDVRIDRIDVPPTARPGQTVTARIMLHATHQTAGQLSLHLEDTPIDLTPDAAGTRRPLTLPAGNSIIVVPLTVGDVPVHRYRAWFEPDDTNNDLIPENNQAEAVTSTPGRGRILVVTAGGTEDPGPIPDALRRADLQVEVRPPETVPLDLLGLQNYDLIILDDVPAARLTLQQQRMLQGHVEDLGAGLLMIGGRSSFGAGGWKGTPIADLLPIGLDPPPELILPQAALVLVLDRSGSMAYPVAGARASQQEVANRAAAAAISSLRENSYVGVISFSTRATTVVPLQQNIDREGITSKVLSISPDGGTRIIDGLLAAEEMLRGVDIDRKRVVCLTDGQGQATREELQAVVRRMASQNIQLTTIGVGDDADFELLGSLAELGGGTFYPVYNPRTLPRVLVDSVQMINQPLIKEGSFQPVLHATGSTLASGLSGAPPLRGLVVTAPIDDPRARIELTHPDGDPLLVHWQIGMGHVGAFTSDAGGAWSEAWDEWAPATALWVELARRLQRPAARSDAELRLETRGDELLITLDATTENAGYTDHLYVPGRVYAPSGDMHPLQLEQIAPGRYEGRAPATESGSYIIALAPRHGQRSLPAVIGAVTRSAGDEYRRATPDTALLNAIAHDSGGRQLDLAAPNGTDLYDRAALPETVSLRPVTTMILLIAAALFLLDILTRRLAWSWSGVAQRLAPALQPAPVRAERTRLSPRKQVTRSVENATSENKTPETDADDEAAAAIRRALGREEPADGAASSGLRAAKRRARRRMGGSGSGNPTE